MSRKLMDHIIFWVHNLPDNLDSDQHRALGGLELHNGSLGLSVTIHECVYACSVTACFSTILHLVACVYAGVGGCMFRTHFNDKGGIDRES